MFNMYVVYIMLEANPEFRLPDTQCLISPCKTRSQERLQSKQMRYEEQIEA